MMTLEGCLVFVQSASTPHWSGACKDGYASDGGILTIQIPGNKRTVFNGVMVGGKMEGIGEVKIVTDSGDTRVYKGGFINGAYAGKCQVHYHSAAEDFVNDGYWNKTTGTCDDKGQEGAKVATPSATVAAPQAASPQASSSRNGAISADTKYGTSRESHSVAVAAHSTTSEKIWLQCNGPESIHHLKGAGNSSHEIAEFSKIFVVDQQTNHFAVYDQGLLKTVGNVGQTVTPDDVQQGCQPYGDFENCQSHHSKLNLNSLTYTEENQEHAHRERDGMDYWNDSIIDASCSKTSPMQLARPGCRLVTRKEKHEEALNSDDEVSGEGRADDQDDACNDARDEAMDKAKEWCARDYPGSRARIAWTRVDKHGSDSRGHSCYYFGDYHCFTVETTNTEPTEVCH
jgi:hypothetical protein